jgi:hypothetical protein
MSHGRRVLPAALFLLAAAERAPAQVPPANVAPRPEFRIDVLGPAPTAAELGAGLNADVGYYSRLELTAAAGGIRRRDATAGVGRLDAVLRLMLDPFAESRWGASLGGGVSARYEAGDRVRPYLLMVIDLEGPPTGSYRLAYQAGVGGGMRVGVVVRRAREVWR